MERASLKTGDNFSDEKKEYTVAEAADLLGISQYTVKKKIREKKTSRTHRWKEIYGFRGVNPRVF